MTRPARFRLMSKNGIPHGTFKSGAAARDAAEELWSGQPANTSDDDQPNGWYLETTVARKLQKRDIQVAGAK